MKPKSHPKLVISLPLSRRGLSALLRKAQNHTVMLKNLGVLAGSGSERAISKNLAKLLDRASGSVTIATPPLTLNKKAAALLKAIRKAETLETAKRKLVSRIVFAILSNNAHALSRPTVQTIEAFRRANELRASGLSYRAISRALAESGIKVSRNSVIKMIRSGQRKEREGSDE